MIESTNRRTMDVKKIERKCIERNSKDRIVIDIKRDKKNGR